MVRKLAPIALLVLVAACGSRSVWEPANENIGRYGSWTDEELLLRSLEGTVFLVLDDHPPSKDRAVSIRVPRDPEGYAAAALLADGLEQGGSRVSWISEDGVAATSSAQRVEVWEVALTIRGAVTVPTHDDPPYRRDATVELRVSSTAPDGHLLWNAQASVKTGRPVSIYNQVKKSVPRAF